VQVHVPMPGLPVGATVAELSHQGAADWAFLFQDLLYLRIVAPFCMTVWCFLGQLWGVPPAAVAKQPRLTAARPSPLMRRRTHVEESTGGEGGLPDAHLIDSNAIVGEGGLSIYAAGSLLSLVPPPGSINGLPKQPRPPPTGVSTSPVTCPVTSDPSAAGPARAWWQFSIFGTWRHWAKPEAKATCVGVGSEPQGMGAWREAAVGGNGTMGGAQPERHGPTGTEPRSNRDFLKKGPCSGTVRHLEWLASR